MELELLKQSFSLDKPLDSILKNLGIGDEEGDENIYIDLSDNGKHESSHNNEVLRLAINDYINERLSAISHNTSGGVANE
jgi:hypothetical protein